MACLSSATFRPNQRFPFLKVSHFLDVCKHPLQFLKVVVGVENCKVVTGVPSDIKGLDTRRMVDSGKLFNTRREKYRAQSS